MRPRSVHAHRIAPVLLALVAAGCAAIPDGAPGEDSAWGESHDVNWVALASDWPGRAEHRTEFVRLTDTATDTSWQLRFEIDLSRRGTTLVALTPLGVPLYSLTARDGSLARSGKAPGVPERAIATMLRDFVLVNWPPEKIAGALTGSGLELVVAAGGRTLLNGLGKPLVSIVEAGVPGGPVSVTHHDLPLTMTIHTIALEAL